jgi:hypothetical protein
VIRWPLLRDVPLLALAMALIVLSKVDLVIPMPFLTVANAGLLQVIDADELLGPEMLVHLPESQVRDFQICYAPSPSS